MSTTPQTYQQWLLTQVDDTDDGDENELVTKLGGLATDTSIDFVKDEFLDTLFDDYGEFVGILVDQAEFLITAAIDFFTSDVTEVLGGGPNTYSYQGFFVDNKVFTIFARGGNDSVIAGPNNDFIDGGSGADFMQGLGGDDTYIVDNAGDTAYEDLSANAGIDTVIASVNLTLNTNVENLVFLDWYDTTTQTLKNLMGWGNASANNLTGNSGNNYLNGLAGS